MGTSDTKAFDVEVADLIRLAGPCAQREGVVIADASGEIVYACEQAIAILGIVRIGAGVDDYSVMHGIFTEEGRPYPSSDLPLARAILYRKTTRNERMLLRRPDGMIHLMGVSARPLFDDARKQVGAAAFIRILAR
jgi:PAS domain-containing protein